MSPVRSVLFDAPGVSVEDGGVPGWAVSGAGVALGIGLSMLLVFLVTRSRPAPATARS